MKRKIQTIFFVAIMLSIGACNIINPNEPIPTYIHIDSIVVNPTDPKVHGSTSSNITDAWVFLDGDNIGNFELPADIPVLMEGDSARLEIAAGIKGNGFSYNRLRYRFYTPYGQSLGKSIGTKQVIKPTVTYRDNLKFLLIEDFENGNSFVSYLGPDTSLVRTTAAPYVFEGTNSGLLYFGNGVRGSRSITAQSFKFPTNADLKSWLEVDYKGNVGFTVELQISTASGTVILSELQSVKPRDDWNKIYIELTSIGPSYPNANVFFIIRAALEADQTDGFLAIDNFKLITQ